VPETLEERLTATRGRVSAKQSRPQCPTPE